MRSHAIHLRLRPFALLAILGAALTGCASAPPGPRGPLLGPGIEGAIDWSYANGPAEAVLPDGTIAKANADNFWSSATIFPRRLEARISPLPWVDVGGQIGWLDGGLELRVGLPALGGRFLPVNLAAGFDTGRVSPFKDMDRSLGSRWLRAEAYPLLTSGRQSLRLVLAAGLDVGRFFHEFDDPRPTTQFYDNFGAPVVDLRRRETRIETSIGVFYQPAGFTSVMFTVSPYFVVDASDLRGDCASCQANVTSYREDWGLVFVSRFAFRHGF